MKLLTTKTSYGLIAVLDLADHYGRQIVQIRDIVARHKVPKNYLEQILNRLGKHGIVKSVRGNKGGYELGAHPDTLTLLTVVEALEGEIQFSERAGGAALEEITGQVESSVRERLNVPLSVLLERQKILENQITFHI